ncbi:hypothetical protein [Flammeovirga aprica]|uniref:Permuted papain-like amidase YaeF/Yiix C92 family enzyme n=1 Tax=Flammeovirga aprica JL-4 TaxID=694437 RepID=A0A7X9RUY2_9BACT|nr:hypothetical protein [Flammeovirga aprica]NME69198.1 hypothetical protein [Flammeovirga aprica JL-4]
MDLLKKFNYFYVPKRKTTYEEFTENALTGDLFFMHGTYKVSRISEIVQRSLWSHSSIIIRREDVEGFLPLVDHEDPLLLWESNLRTPVIDQLTGVTKSGPTLVSLKDRLVYNYKMRYDTKFAYRPLYTDRSIQLYQDLSASILKMHGGDFCKPVSRYITNFKQGRLHNVEINDNTYFCSQIVAQSYIDIGLLTDYYPANSYAPIDFTPKRSTLLKNRSFLGDEYRLDINKKNIKLIEDAPYQLKHIIS